MVVWAQTEAEQQSFIKEMHSLKTSLFMSLVEGGSLPLRPGVARLVQEARAAGVPVATRTQIQAKATNILYFNLLRHSDGSKWAS